MQSMHTLYLHVSSIFSRSLLCTHLRSLFSDFFFADDTRTLYACRNVDVSRVLVLGSPGCGKSTLISQLATYLQENSTGISRASRRSLRGNHHANNSDDANNGGNTRLVLNFKEIISLDDYLPQSPINIYQPNAYIVVYAVNDR